MAKAKVNRYELANYLYHNLLLSGYQINQDDLLLIADMTIDYLSMLSDTLH